MPLVGLSPCAGWERAWWIEVVRWVGAISEKPEYKNTQTPNATGALLISSIVLVALVSGIFKEFYAYRSSHAPSSAPILAP